MLILLAWAGLFLAAVVGALPSAAVPSDNPDVASWKITGVSSAYQVTGSWSPCIYFAAEDTPHTVTCSLAKTLAVSVTGTLTVSDGTASAAVGFQVQHSYSVTGTESYTPSTLRSGEVDWAPVYSQKTISQREYLCALHGGDCIATGKTATAYAKKYVAPTFRIQYVAQGPCSGASSASTEASPDC